MTIFGVFLIFKKIIALSTMNEFLIGNSEKDFFGKLIGFIFLEQF